MAKKKGHPRNFETPELLDKAFQEYKEERKEEAKEWAKVQYVGKDGKKVIDYPIMPLTLEGFYVFCRKKGYGEVRQYYLNQDGFYNEYITICRAHKEEIRDNQIKGGLLGYFNPSITQRLNNLKEQVEQNSTHNVKILSIDPIADAENDN